MNRLREPANRWYPVCLLLVVAGIFVAASPALSAERSAPLPSLDDQLFDGLDDLPREAEIDRKLFGRDDTPAAGVSPHGKKPGADQRRIDMWNDLLEQELKGAAVDEGQNPLLSIARGMRSAERLIRQTESGTPTQTIQSQVVGDLDQLLRQAGKRSPSGASPSRSQTVARREPTEQPKPSAPKEGNPDARPAMTTDVPSGEAGGEFDETVEMMAAIKQIWGELPEVERQEMLQLSIERFLPKYADQIEQYFKRLAEDRKEKP